MFQQGVHLNPGLFLLEEKGKRIFWFQEEYNNNQTNKRNTTNNMANRPPPKKSTQLKVAGARISNLHTQTIDSE
jgi:hypothetical protein